MSHTTSALIDLVASESTRALPQERRTSRKIQYWGTTGLVTTVTLLAAFSYLTAIVLVPALLITAILVLRGQRRRPPSA